MPTLRWLVTMERTLSNRENDSNFAKGLSKIKKIGNSCTILMWIVALFSVVTTAITSIFLSSKNEVESDEACNKVLESLYPFVEHNFKIPNFKQNTVYENVVFMQTFLNQSIGKCEKPAKIFPWLTMTPYDKQISPNYELTLLFQVLVIHFCALSLIPIDMILPTMMLYIKFQLEMINMDLVSLI